MITPILRRLHWLPIHQLVAFKIAFFPQYCIHVLVIVSHTGKYPKASTAMRSESAWCTRLPRDRLWDINRIANFCTGTVCYLLWQYDSKFEKNEKAAPQCDAVTFRWLWHRLQMPVLAYLLKRERSRPRWRWADYNGNRFPVNRRIIFRNY